MPETNRMLNKKDLNKIFRRSYCYECSFNFVRQQHMGFIWSMAPALKKIYKDDPQGLAEACKRQISFFNTTPQIAPWVVGIETALEEENKKSGNTMGEVVSAVKTSLMGPISVIGDTMFLTAVFACWRYYRGASRCSGQLACHSTVSSHLQYPAFSVPLFRHPSGLSMGQRLLR